jgi:hypothetical protein
MPVSHLLGWLVVFGCLAASLNKENSRLQIGKVGRKNYAQLFLGFIQLMRTFILKQIAHFELFHLRVRTITIA